MEIISPEQAADETEARWLCLARDDRVVLACGWCGFDAALLKRYRGEGDCVRCPVLRVFGCHCTDVPEVARWMVSQTGERAMEVYELAVRMRHPLIQEAYRILEERDIEMPLQRAKR